MNRYFIAGFFGLSMAVGGCKKTLPEADRSQSKNVETASQGIDDAKEGSLQTGKIEYCLPEKGTNSNDVAKALIKNLPERLAKEYEKVKVSIIANVDEIDRTCRKVNEVKLAGKNSGSEKFIACWGPSSKTDLVAARPEIYLLDDVDIVHSNLIAMVIDSYSELYIDQIMTIAAKKLSANDPAKVAFQTFLDSRKELAMQFAQVLADGGSEVSTLYKSRFLGRPDAADDQLVADVGFQNFVLAEVGESAFCSESTRKSLSEKKFQNLQKAFAPFDAFFKSVN